MKSFVLFFLVLGLASSVSPAETAKTKVLVVTGGHGFKPEPFFQIFKDNLDIVYAAAAQGKSAEAYDREDLFTFDVVVLYDSPGVITATQKARFLALFERGIGVIVLHHAYLSYPMWDEYERICGGKYVYLDEQMTNGITSSDYTRKAVEIPVTIATRDHPVVKSLNDFAITDELYTNMHMVGVVTPLLKTGDELLAWARTEKKSRVVGTILGHGPSAYQDPNFRRFLAQAIQWSRRQSE